MRRCLILLSSILIIAANACFMADIIQEKGRMCINYPCRKSEVFINRRGSETRVPGK